MNPSPVNPAPLSFDFPQRPPESLDLLAVNDLGDRVRVGWTLFGERAYVTGTIQFRTAEGDYVIEDGEGFGWLVRPEDVFSAGPA